MTELFSSLFSLELTYQECADKLNVLEHERVDELRKYFCNLILDEFVRDTFVYPENFLFMKSELPKLFCEQVEKLDTIDNYYEAVTAFMKKDYKKCLRCIDQYFTDITEKEAAIINSYDIGYYLLAVFKNAFPGF